MIPAVATALNQPFDIETRETSNTYYLDIENNIIHSRADGLAAIKQAVFLILNIERYDWVIFSWDYGVELSGLFGKPITWVIPEVERRISEAILQDDRVTSADDFNFTRKHGSLTVTFTVHSIFGDFPAQKEVIF